MACINYDNGAVSCKNPTTAENPASSSECIAVTAERAYYRCDRFFIKRSLRPSEFQTGYKGLHIPRLGKERLRNEAESLRFIRHSSNIPVPTVYGAFEVDDAFFLITDFVDGVAMSRLSEDDKKIVMEELDQHRATLQQMRSHNIGGPSGILIPPYRIMRHTTNDMWPTCPSETSEYVFCHNDLSQQNIIVDPHSLKINAIIDWEYAGFFPKYFEFPFYKRLGPSIAVDGEQDDVPKLLQFLAEGV
ncbi:hypothetical protein N7539_008561 [Penicillium diatomitis]|uniref:Aminoglycoside phosphotransferase domain-containing protein n=1 Tax=Penicillium diatomitis TaxID=2819901 RepID=A0A9W9WRL7_9EURO|nr:uncharacterized protein N7539_008561 [Penicillium diatomitis]KAJ5471992.1 hypothetical protein N7539_008561 [Penicillium diatomitis]